MSVARFEETAREIEAGREKGEHKRNLARLLEKEGSVIRLPIDKIETRQNLRNGPHEKIAELAESIREVGLLQPVVITVVGDSVVCVSGHRRIEAMRLLEEERILCTVRRFDELPKRDLAQLAENLSRSDLQALDIADRMYSLKKAGYTQARLEEIFDRDRKTVSRYQKIGAWPDEAKQVVRKHPVRCTTKRLFQIASRRLTDKQVVSELKSLVANKRKNAPTRKAPPRLLKVVTSAAKKTELKILANGNDDNGKITINYSSRDELKKVIGLLDSF